MIGIPKEYMKNNLHTLLHLSIIIFSTISLLTGLRIASTSHDIILVLSPLLPQGYVHYTHILSAYAIYAVGISYICCLTLLKCHKKKKDHNRYHQKVIFFGYFILSMLMITGGMQLFNLSDSALIMQMHYYASIGLVLFIFLHAGIYYLQHGGKKLLLSIKPKRILSKKEILVIAFSFLSYVGFYNFLPMFQYHKLYIKKISLDTFIDIDGMAKEEIWSKADALEVETHDGMNFKGGKSRIKIAGLHNGQDIFFYIVWEDSTKSIKHLPLVKTKKGWKIKEKGFYRFNETVYYEDKLAIMISTNCDLGASSTAHLGPRPLNNKPLNWHGKGYHYSEDGAIRDLWQWKAVRTNDMYLADDNFIGAPDIVRDGARRYTAGYMPDGKESGAYIMNWQWYNKDTVTPKRLPKKVGTSDKYRAIENDNSLTVPWYSYSLYSKEYDTYPAGTIIPSVLYASNRFEGDRADVRARGIWKDEYWRLELSRALSTKSEHDIALKDGVCLWISPFDHSQIGHSRHTLPIKLKFEKDVTIP